MRRISRFSPFLLLLIFSILALINSAPTDNDSDATQSNASRNPFNAEVEKGVKHVGIGRIPVLYELEKSLLGKRSIKKSSPEKAIFENGARKKKMAKMEDLLERARKNALEFGSRPKNEADDVVTPFPSNTTPPSTLPPLTLPPSTLPPSTLPPPTLPPPTLPPSTPPPLPDLPAQYSSVTAMAVNETEETSVIRRWVDRDADLARAEFVEFEPEEGEKSRTRIYHYPTQEIFDIVEDGCDAFNGTVESRYNGPASKSIYNRSLS